MKKILKNILFGLTILFINTAYCKENINLKLLYQFDEYVETFDFTPNGKYMAVLFWNNILHLYQIKAKKIVLEQEVPHTKSYTFSPCNSYLAALSWKDNLTIINLKKGKPVLLIDSVRDFSFCKNKKLIGITFKTNKTDKSKKENCIHLFEIPNAILDLTSAT